MTRKSFVDSSTLSDKRSVLTSEQLECKFAPPLFFSNILRPVRIVLVDDGRPPEFKMAASKNRSGITLKGKDAPRFQRLSHIIDNAQLHYTMRTLPDVVPLPKFKTAAIKPEVEINFDR